MNLYIYYGKLKYNYKVDKIIELSFYANESFFHFATTYLVGKYCYFISLYKLNEKQIEKLNKLQKGKV